VPAIQQQGNSISVAALDDFARWLIVLLSVPFSNFTIRFPLAGITSEATENVPRLHKSHNTYKKFLEQIIAQFSSIRQRSPRKLSVQQLFYCWECQSRFTADSQSVSQSVCLGVEPTLWTFDQILLPFQEFGSGICCPICGAPSLTRGRVCPLQVTVWSSVCVYIYYSSFCVSHFYHIYIYIYILYNISKASFSPGSVQQIMSYYSLVAHATTAV
jgi:hypothetical protein